MADLTDQELNDFEMNVGPRYEYEETHDVAMRLAHEVRRSRKERSRLLELAERLSSHRLVAGTFAAQSIRDRLGELEPSGLRDHVAHLAVGLDKSIRMADVDREIGAVANNMKAMAGDLSLSGESRMLASASYQIALSLQETRRELAELRARPPHEHDVR